MKLVSYSSTRPQHILVNTCNSCCNAQTTTFLNCLAPVSQIDCLVGGGLPYRLVKRRCTRVTEFVFANSSSQKAFSTTVAAIQ